MILSHYRRKKQWIGEALGVRKRCSAKRRRRKCRVRARKTGALRKALRVRAGHKIPVGLLERAAKRKGLIGLRARLALNLRKFQFKKGHR